MNRDIERELFEAIEQIKEVDEESTELKAKFIRIYSMVSKDIKEQIANEKHRADFVKKYSFIIDENVTPENMFEFLKCNRSFEFTLSIYKILKNYLREQMNE